MFYTNPKVENVQRYKWVNKEAKKAVREAIPKVWNQ